MDHRGDSQLASPAPAAPSAPTDLDARAHAAANVIQRTYRGHRTRRQLDGLGLDASTRWTELLKQAEYSNVIRPRARSTRQGTGQSQEEWRRLAKIARYAGNDDTSDTEGDGSMTPAQLQEYKQRRRQAKQEREGNAKMMGLEYFLEMVDTKHRYGSHLRSYHAEWKKADTNENFFYWLDQGDGRNVEVEHCSREKLERDQVRYLTREERYKYRVNIDKNGRLRWAKNGEAVNTSPDFRDSLEGIVPKDDPTPSYRDEKPHASTANTTEDSTSSGSGSEGSEADGQHYVNRELKDANGVKKVQYVSAAALLNHLLQSTTKKNTWIFVADTSFRLYIGIKQSGAFQHSSFLHGARISAAGLIKVKNGQLRSLSPLSGHYRPPTKNFRAFVHSLKEEGVDMSRVSISKSYAVLLGLEGYLKTKKKAKDGMTQIELQSEKIFHPEEAKQREERERDKSQSAKKEREHLEELRRKEKEQGSWRKKMSIRMKSLGSHPDASSPPPPTSPPKT